jgi:hypothetical protein
MAKRDTLWTCVGITKNVGVDSGIVVDKVRCGVDMAQRVKSSQSKTYTKIKGEYTNCLRNDYISLPTPMLRLDALMFALAAPEFQSAEDQAMIQEQIDTRTPKAPRVPKEKKVKAVKANKAEISLDSIKSRAKKPATVADVLGAVVDAQ